MLLFFIKEDLKMSNKELKQKLLDKMRKEQEDFAEELKRKTPQEILDNAYWYATRQDILEETENVDLTDEEIQSLLNLNYPLSYICDLYVYDLHDYVEKLWECIEIAAREEYWDNFECVL